jgi:hypothetical protein
MHMLLAEKVNTYRPSTEWMRCFACTSLPPCPMMSVWNVFFTSKNMPKQSTRKLKKRLI